MGAPDRGSRRPGSSAWPGPAAGPPWARSPGRPGRSPPAPGSAWPGPALPPRGRRARRRNGRAVRRLRLGGPFELEDGPNLDAAAAGGRDPGGRVDGLVEVLAVHDVVPAELLLG